jgi:hypothetical protein
MERMTTVTKIILIALAVFVVGAAILVLGWTT